jgi:hypothetical protein
MMEGLSAWQSVWVDQHTTQAEMHAFRMVETQHIAATMRLVDSAAEQNLLEQMLEGSKPPLPPSTQGQHYLLTAPFRYFPRTGSRFRIAGTSGIWYGADHPFAACAEIGYWRQRFLLDSAGLVRQSVSTELSMFEAKVSGLAVDLMSPPWNLSQEVWQHPQDYTQTQRLGALVREHGGVSWMRYGSVRAPGHVCAAVFDPHSLSMITPQGRYEQWHCQVVSDKVTFSNGRVRYDFL